MGMSVARHGCIETGVGGCDGQGRGRPYRSMLQTPVNNV